MDGGILELSMVTTTDDAPERLAQRMDNMSNEIRHREQEVEALKAQQQGLITAMEEVRICLVLVVKCCRADSIVHVHQT